MSRTSGFIIALTVLAVLIGLTFGGLAIGRYAQNMLEMQHAARDLMMNSGGFFVVVLIYCLLIAFPFIPGAEMGIAFLVIFGAEVAPVLYIATIAALTLSYSVGRLTPPNTLERFFERIGLRAVARLLRESRQANNPAALNTFRPLPNWIKGILRFRVLTLAVLINTPGNTLIGGGGGIALTAGSSRFLTFPQFLLAVSIAVAPIPAFVTLAAWLGN